MNASPQFSRGIFVTGTDTGIGKTVLSALLCRMLDAAYFKPLQTGADQDDDTATVAHLAGLPAERILAPIVRLRDPPVPGPGRRPAWGRVLDAQALTLPRSSRPLVVEGAPAACWCPLPPALDMAGLMARFGLPVILAARSGLGTVNHTLLSLEALRARGLDVAGVVLCGPENPENVRDVETLGESPVLFSIPTLDPMTPQALGRPGRAAVLAQASRCRFRVPGSREVAEIDARHVWHPFTQAQTADPAVPVVRGRGAKLFTADGREFLDLACSLVGEPARPRPPGHRRSRGPPGPDPGAGDLRGLHPRAGRPPGRAPVRPAARGA